MSKKNLGYLYLLASVCVGLCFARPASAQIMYTTMINYGQQSVKLASPAHQIFVGNNGTSTITISSFTLSNQPTFQLNDGTAPKALQPGQQTSYNVLFAPTQAQSYSGTFTFTIGSTTYMVPLSGTGLATSAVATPNTTSVAYGNQAVGVSRGRVVKLTNTGTTPVTVQMASTCTPEFPVAGFVPNTVLQGGQSLSVTVQFSPVMPITYYGTLEFTFDVLPAVGVTLTGTGTPATKLSVTTLPALPVVTQNAAYLVNLQAAGNNGTVSWQLASGTLPAGLTLSSAGAISGTLASSVGAGNYTFQVKARDSTTVAFRSLVMQVVAPTGANCNNIQWDVAGTSNPLVALTDLGTGTYLGTEGGLYPNGSNQRPATQDSAGVAFADQVTPLDQFGNPSTSGKIGFLALGLSTARKTFDTFIQYANSEPVKNPNLVFAEGALAGEDMSQISQSTSTYWTTIFNYILPNSNLTPAQVEVVWCEGTDAQPTGTFPADITTLQAEFETFAQVLHNFFPNLKLAYFSSRIYGGYSNGLSNADPEPYAYEDAYAVRGMIIDQINGAANLNYNAANGPVVAPWLSWGAYYWSNGLLGRSDGLVWTCQDVQSDGYHPSDPFGRTVGTGQLLNFFKTDDTTTPWFLAPVARPVTHAQTAGTAAH